MKKLFFAPLMLLLLIFSNHAFTQAVHTYMKVTASGYNFNGGVTVAAYEKQIEVFSFSDGLQGCTTTSTNLGATAACKPSFSGFEMIIPLTLAVNDFRSVMLQGKLLSTVDLAMVKTSGGIPNAFYKIHMENVSVTAIQEGASSENPTISVGLNPTKIAWQVITQNADGSAGPGSSFGWDLSRNTTFNYSF